MSAKKGLLSRLFGSNTDSDCCQVTIVADEEDTTNTHDTPSDTTASDPCCSEDTTSTDRTTPASGS